MSWFKIFIFSLLLVIFQVTPTTLTSLYLGINQELSLLRFWGEYFAIGFMGFLVFFLMGFQRLPNPYLHAFIVALLQHLFCVVFYIAVLGGMSYSILSAIELSFTLLALLAGTFLGLKVAHSKGEQVAT
ncbi:hypothetical protein OPS25_08235 [Alteromonas ponticola]|uniref:Uncharacterized protein n=1 Tax=Alteromonas aquimaris TaxID=2998417 RepID=A0ABT3P8S1_9ALTE|nr:hypothetical protein [Alteromonas aquimaris]MCW8108481.1 hypothetical protein [Alteromonas aquimaris]